jgi:hypothetical protein
MQTTLNIQKRDLNKEEDLLNSKIGRSGAGTSV